jgi:hypothetical protein
MEHLLKQRGGNYHHGEQKANTIFRLMFAYGNATVSREYFQANQGTIRVEVDLQT